LLLELFDDLVGERFDFVVGGVEEDEVVGYAVFIAYLDLGELVGAQGDGAFAGEDGVVVRCFVPGEADAVFVALDVFADEVGGTAAEGGGGIEDGAVPKLVAVLDGLGGTN